MNINWKQGLFAAALLLSVSLLFVGCGKCKTDNAVADKSTGEIVGEEIDVIEVVPSQTPNEKPNAVKEQNPAETTPSAQPNNEAPAMTPPATNPAPAADAPTNQTPEPAAADDAAPSSTTSDVTVSTSCNDETSEPRFENEQELNPVIESESASCCSYCHTEPACCPACSPAVEACQPACDAAPACAPDPTCAPAPICAPAPAWRPCCSPCRPRYLRRCCRPCCIFCRVRIRFIRECSPWRSACEPACVTACTCACAPACQSEGCTNRDCSGSWSNEQNIPQESAPTDSQPKTKPNKTTSLPDPKISEDVQRAKASTAVGSAPSIPETPSIVLPEAK